MGTYRVRDRATGRVISIPWDDPNSRPTPEDIANFQQQEQGPSIEEINMAPEISIEEEPSLLSRAIGFLPKLNPITPGRNPTEVLDEIRKPVDEAATFYSGKAVGSPALQYGPRKTAGELAISGVGLDPQLNPETADSYKAAIARPLVGTLATAATDPTMIVGALRGVAPVAKMADRALAGVGAAQGGVSALESGSGAIEEFQREGASPRALELLLNAGLGAGFGYLGYRGARGPLSKSTPTPEPQVNLKPEIESPIGYRKIFEEPRVETGPRSTLDEIDALIEQGPTSRRDALPLEELPEPLPLDQREYSGPRQYPELEVLPELESSITNDRPALLYDADGNPIPVTTKDYGPRVAEALIPERNVPEIDLSQVSDINSPDINPIRRGYLADEAVREYQRVRELRS